MLNIKATTLNDVYVESILKDVCDFHYIEISSVTIELSIYQLRLSSNSSEFMNVSKSTTLI